MSYLQWSKPDLTPPPLPSHITRIFIPGPSGQLELISAHPPSSYRGPIKTPFFFQHGGFGHASVWLEYMTFFSQFHNIPCYALSVRGHGFSWYPSWFRMVFATSKRRLVEDLVAGIRYAQKDQEDRTGKKMEFVLVGHSGGGGLAQIALSAKDIQVRGLALVAAMPCYGSFGVHWGWLKIDPWITLRCYKHWMHPISPLSSLLLVKRAFFCPEMPDDRVDAFAKRMSYYESYLWPMGMLLPFVNVKNVIQQITNWGSGERILLLAAEHDKLISVKQTKGSAERYRAGVSQLVKEKKLDASIKGAKEDEFTAESEGQGVRLRIVKGSGHHVQNDLQWEDGAQKLLEFHEQL